MTIERLYLTIVVATMFIAGCTADTGSPSPVCNPKSTSSSLSLRAYLIDSGPATAEDGFAGSNGTQFLYVSERCEFWANNMQWVTRYGVLDQAAIDSIDQTLQISNLGEFGGDWKTDSCADPSKFVVKSGSATLACACHCQNADTPAPIKGIDEQFGGLLEPLNASGAVWSGDAEVFVRDAPELEAQDTCAWPEGIPAIETLETPFEQGIAAVQAGNGLPGKYLDAPPAKQVRVVMQEYADEFPERARLGSALPISSSGRTFAVYLRDIIPGLE